jgi:hypothetical protein
MLKKAIAVAVLIFASVTPVQAEDLSWYNRTISWEDTAPLHNHPVAYAFSAGSGNPCSGDWSTSCDPKVGYVEVNNFLPLCDSVEGSDKRLDCLDSVYVDLNGTQVKGVPIANQVSIWDVYGFSAKPELGISKAVPFGIYKFPGLSHAKGDLFMVYPFSSKGFNIDSKPGNKSTADQTRYTFFIAPTFQDTSKVFCSFLNTPDGRCWLTGSFLTNTRFTLNLKLTAQPVGWFSGRLTAPDVQIKPAPDGRTQISFTGDSQAVPSISRNYHYSIQSEKDEWSEISKAMPEIPWDKDGKQVSSGIYHSSDAISVFEKVVAGVPSFNNADELKNIWRIESKSTNDSVVTGCLTSEFTGVVSSNALTYENAIPTWDKTNSSLVYRIASPHNALGVEFSGRYDLLISEKVGKCLWNVSELSPAAQISVTSADGSSKVFTAAGSTSGGYYKFIAAGFTFSTNKISVKLVSKTTNAPVAKPSASPKSKAAVTITCVKGKVQKKVSAVNPKCPTGYKKK